MTTAGIRELHRDEIAVADWSALGTSVRLVVTDGAALGDARDLLEIELRAMDLACSRFRDDSEIIRLETAAPGTDVAISPLLVQAIGVALDAARLTDGLVDPTVGRAMEAVGYDRDFAELGDVARAPGVTATVRAAGVPGWSQILLDREAGTVCVPAGLRLDLGATAKALAADRAAKEINDRLGIGVLVDLGGDLAVRGDAPHGGWCVRVQDRTSDGTDEPASGPCAVVVIDDGAIATSSTTARRWQHGGATMHHILDPRTSMPSVSPWRTVSVAAASCVYANIASTASIIRGSSAPTWLASLGLPARLVRHDGRVTTVGGWPGDPEPGHRADIEAA